MSEARIKELSAEVKYLKAKVQQFEDERAAYSLVYLEMTGGARAALNIEHVRVFAPVLIRGSTLALGKITTNAGAAKTAAHSKNKPNRVLECRLEPIRMHTRDDEKDKWPKTATPI